MKVNKALVVETAAALADEQGIDAITLAAIAQRLGIKTPSLYNHIDGLAGLRKEMALYGIRQLTEALTQASIGKAGDKALLSIGLSYVTFVRQHPGLYEATLPAAAYDEEIQAAGDALVRLLLRVLEEYQLAEEDALHLVRGFRSIVHGFSSLEQKGGFGLSLDRDESLRRLLSTFIKGLHEKLEI
ncbi:WHG domain-containing protein [Ectobacillus antri]|jgi:AcrR family transcriptional regulator|uniref:WHG domain-containing protein n=1 Tax=Ectobacillus antri TaxID=2486280 RepID=A0ABT6H6Y8_9BACI|nr:TetR/AcrR family transcriptional regulator [Ectobacillus antri]MDG4657139.1 WHG domain-containing protein [Ectobacillus antri]MDG5754598.1 WHG domain-containing protein [Ectobacillus antri]